MQITKHRVALLIQHFSDLLLLLGCQTMREFDGDFHDQIAPLPRPLALRHALLRISDFAAWLRRCAGCDIDLLAIDRLDSSLPACQGLF